MTTTPEYDAILARKIREREEGNKGESGEFTAKFGLGRIPHTVKYEISQDGKTVNIEAPHTDIIGNLGTLQPGQSTKVTGIPEKLQPKRRGRPKGSKNKPKVK